MCKHSFSDKVDSMQLKTGRREFPGGLVVRIPGFHFCGPGSNPGRGTEIPQGVWCGQKILIKRTGKREERKGEITDCYIVNRWESNDTI